jgi:hypothetical protein
MRLHGPMLVVSILLCMCVCGSPLGGFALHISTCYELCASHVRRCVHTALVVPSGAEIM